jgi:hypothetical protein
MTTETTELKRYQGCFYEDGPEACEKEINVRTSFVILLYLHHQQLAGSINTPVHF